MKYKLNNIEVLINSCINDDKIVSVEKQKSWKWCRMYYKQHLKRIVAFVNKLLWKQTLLSEKENKIEQCFYQVVLFVVRKNQGLLKIKERGDYSGN